MNTVARKPSTNPRGLVLPEGLSFEEWLKIGKRLSAQADALAWIVGDWLFYGEWEYGKRCHEGVTLLGLEAQTLYNYASVARRFDLSRRRESLSFSHHAEVASLDVAHADRMLEQAEQHGWTRAELREALRQERALGGGSVADERTAPLMPPESQTAGKAQELRAEPAVQFELTVASPRYADWCAAAARAERTLFEWVTDALDEAASAALS